MPTRRTRPLSDNDEEEEEQYRSTKKRGKVSVEVEEGEESEQGGGGGGGGEAEPFRRDFYNAVYSTVRTIPEGKVASYGTIGKLIGHPRHSRMVGAALKCLPPSMSSPYLPQQQQQRVAPSSNSGDSTTSSTTISSGSVIGTTDIFEYLSHDPTTTTTTEDLFNFDLFPTTQGEEEEEFVLPLPEPNPQVVPWWRVVSSTGVISPRGNDLAVRRQADYLLAEGVQVKDGPRGGGTTGSDGHFGLGGVSGGRVSMSLYGWKG
ncbi:hypothetical protein JCM3765_007096 [Sporobolomyces pararoseus]